MELSVSGVTKRFGNLIAVNDCSLKVPSDRIFALESVKNVTELRPLLQTT